ncbi:MAG: RNA polymerase sporulation sigma factor SigH [Acetivibrio sp.]
MANRFFELTDEEIIEKIQQGDKEALDYLLENYKNLVRKKARKLFLIGGDRDDLIQEGMIGLYKAVRDYDAKKESSFQTFAELCITRQMYDAIKASNRQKNRPLNTYVSFYGDPFCQEIHSSLADNKENPEALLIDQENLNTLKLEIQENLSSFEMEVMQLYLEGRQYLEIAQLLKREPKAVDNALQRVKSKILKMQKNPIDK